DLLAALEEASGRDLSAWSGQWLETTGPSTLTAELDVTSAGEGPATVAALRVRQEGAGGVRRDHRPALGCYTADAGGALVRTHRFETDVSGPVTEVTDAAGIPVPDLVLVNDDDLTYAKVRLDARSAATALRAAGTVGESLSRAVLWSALWNATRDAVLPAERFLDAVVTQLPAEEEIGIARDLLAHAATAVEHYLPASQRDGARELLAAETFARLGRCAAGSGLQLVWARAFADAATRAPGAAGHVRTVLA